MPDGAASVFEQSNRTEYITALAADVNPEADQPVGSKTYAA
jgi:hypothetical protein